jgi:hypothetical protein
MLRGNSRELLICALSHAGGVTQLVTMQSLPLVQFVSIFSRRRCHCAGHTAVFVCSVQLRIVLMIMICMPVQVVPC